MAAQFEGKRLYNEERTECLETNEGARAFDEAISFLKK